MSGAPPPSAFALALRSLGVSLWFAGCFFLGIPALLQWAVGGYFAPRWSPLSVAGLGVVLACGAAIALLVLHFAQLGRGTPAPFDPPRRLLAGGAYARVRNPMYLCYLGLLAGLALLLASPALGVYAAAFAALAHLYVVRVEEPALRRRFGADYEAYCRAVPRWLPRVR